MNTIECNELMFTRKFNWDKSWVRPYESIYSIIANACRINMVSGIMLLKEYGIKINRSNCGWYIPDLMLQDCSTRASSAEQIYEFFLPNWYKDEIQLFRKIGSCAGHLFFNLNDFCYCPKCIKEGYHSYLHQIYSMEECPFHAGTKLKTAIIGRRYSLSYISFDGRGYEKEDTYIETNPYMFPLPCYRKESFGFYLIKTSPYKKYEKISIVSSYLYREINKTQCFKQFMLNVSPKEVIRVDKYSGDFSSFKREFLEWFNRQNLPTYLFDDDIPYKIQRISPFDSWLLDHCLYAKFISFLTEELIDYDNVRNYYISVSGKRINSDDIVSLKIAFISMLYDGNHEFAALNFRWLTIRSGYDNEWLQRTKNGCSIRALSNYESSVCFASNFSDWPSADFYIIMHTIINNFFDTLWDQYYKLASRKEGISIKEGWKELNPPEYAVCHVKHQDYYEILRY